MSNIDKPRHYMSGPRHHHCGTIIECIDVSEVHTGNVAQAIQYLWRHQHKGSAVEDLRKAAWFAAREATRLEKEEEHATRHADAASRAAGTAAGA